MCFFAVSVCQEVEVRMDPFVYLILFVLVIIFVVLLPLLGGIGSYSVKKNEARGLNKGRSGTDKKRLKLEKEDIPLKFKVGLEKDGKKEGKRFEIDGKTGLKRRVIGKYSNNENEFDYDVDELIAEDLKEQQEEESARYEQFLGKENETQELLV